MPERNIDTVLGAKREFLSSSIPALQELDVALLKVIESFSSAVEQSEGLNAAVGAVGKTAEETARKEAEAAAEKVEQYKKNEDTITALEREYKQLSLTTAESIALKVEEFQLQGATIEQAVKYQQLLNDIEEKKQGIADVRPSAAAYSDFGKLYEDEAIALQAGREGHTMYAESLNMLRGIQNAAYQAMEDQLMSFIETGKFSVGAFAKIVAQQVKIELVGMAAIAAVKAIFFTALGFGHLDMSNKPLAAAAFTSAKFLGMVGATSLAAAAGVNSLLEKSKDSSSGASSARGGLLSAYPAPGGAEPKQIQNITFQIYNPLSQQNWAEIAENNILPALKDASDRNIVMNVKTVYA